ncbi:MULTISPECIES: alpha/beta hydrolase [unclassified Clostridium]|uniref:alpha/beta fold hydrolase n=1 Tax=unclassified Clostridium TaxID=2614128 RepID=UPI0002975B1A|nr:MULTISPECIES: alpha/beta hydrolase [unclassified Clostridium]EKQ54545.1 MAG: putative hydrolase or acyltransferase of alpha/beta superfamily [Clostridium sp. Maddingley MBC34-26]
MRLLLLYGVNCTTKIWDRIKPYLNKFEVDYVEYPHEITLKAKKVNDISKWVYENFNHNYDAVIGHSLGGIIALELVEIYKMKFNKIVMIDTNLKPANEFYRNLMTLENEKEFGKEIFDMFRKEKEFYTNTLFNAIQEDFDYTSYVKEIKQKIYVVYGDRNLPNYEKKIDDLNLTDEILKNIDLRFVNNACHLAMIENPKQLYKIIESIVEEG